jgi:hypothetical protein
MWTKDQQKEAVRKYRQTPEGHRKKIEADKKYRASTKGREKNKASAKIWRERPEVKESHRQRNREYARRTTKRLREKVFSHYGAKCSWPGCNITDPDMLQVDHINGDGAQHRREIGRDGGATLRFIVKNNYPMTFRILCANHNWKHRANLARQQREQDIFG